MNLFVPSVQPSLRWLFGAGVALAAFAIVNVPTANAAAAETSSVKPATKVERYRVSACDWMMLKRQKLGAIQLAKDIGADGVEIDMGSLGQNPTFQSQLGDPAIRQQFIDKAREVGIEFSSVAMSGFYAQAFAERPVERMVQDTIDTAKALGVKIIFLPLGVRTDLVKHPELRPAVVERLKDAARRAEAAGVVIGIETALDAKGEVALLDEIGSPAIRSYFNFSNALQNGRDLHAELRTLGRDRICQIHCTDEDGVWLENNTRLDMKKVKQTLDEMGWSGWLVIERSRDARDARNVRKNFGANAAFLKAVFQGK